MESDGSHLAIDLLTNFKTIVIFLKTRIIVLRVVTAL